MTPRAAASAASSAQTAALWAGSATRTVGVAAATLMNPCCIWGLESNAVENHVEVYVAILRKKLSGIGSDVKIVSIRGLGYHLEVKDT